MSSARLLECPSRILHMQGWAAQITCFSRRPQLPRWCSGKESAYQCRRCKRYRFNSWVRKSPWSRKQQPTPVFLSGKLHGQRSLEGYSPWGLTEPDRTEHTHISRWPDPQHLQQLYPGLSLSSHLQHFD